MNILVFGHIPSWAGGKQESGLANVIYQLAYHMANCDELCVCLAATDVNDQNIKIDKLNILGWTKKGLVKYCFTHPLLSLYWLIVVVCAKLIYGPIISVPGYFFKGLHLRRSIDVARPEIVHMHGMTAYVYDKIVPNNIKIIVTLHGIIGNDQTIPFQKHYKKMEKKIVKSKRYYYIIVISKRLIDDYGNLYGEIKSPIISIPNAYDNKSFYYIEHKSSSQLVLLTIASLSENKGQMRVLKALANSKRKIKYICIGAGTKEQYDAHASFAKSNNIDYINMGVKKPNEIRQIFSQADFMILPSSTEGFGLVYLESIACGVPVILPKQLPIVKEKDIIIPGKNAVLLDDCSIESIQKGLDSLDSNIFKHKDVSETIIDYTWENIANRYYKYIKYGCKA